jgi:hypothetical protein
VNRKDWDRTAGTDRPSCHFGCKNPKLPVSKSDASNNSKLSGALEYSMMVPICHERGHTYPV